MVMLGLGTGGDVSYVGIGVGSFGVAGGSCDFRVGKFPRRGPAGRRGGKDDVRQVALLKFKRSRAATGRRHTLAVLSFRLTREAKVSEGRGSYVVGMKAQKWAKG